jgi:hypothetical protein
VPDKRNQTIHPKPVPPFKDGLWITSAPADVYREDDIWRKSAIQLMWDERKTVIPTPLIDLKASSYKSVYTILCFIREIRVIFSSKYSKHKIAYMHFRL